MKNSLFSSCLILFLATAFLQVSCQHEAYVTQKLTGESVQADLPYMRLPDHIRMLDSTIIMVDFASDSCYYHLCSYPDFVYQYSIGRNGNGPGEIVFPTSFQIYENSIMLLDGAQGNLFQHTPHSGQMLRTQRFDIAFASDFILLNDTTIITGDFSGQSRIVAYTLHSKRELFSFPLDAKENPERGYIWRSFFDLNRSNNKLVMATQFGEVIEIYNLNDSSYVRKVGKKGIPQSASQHITGYCDVTWRGNDIYALYASKEDFPEQAVPHGGNMIHVFNEQGEKRMVYYLDKFITSFTIDEKRNLIVGITPNEDDPIYIFKMTDKD